MSSKKVTNQIPERMRRTSNFQKAIKGSNEKGGGEILINF